VAEDTVEMKPTIVIQHVVPTGLASIRRGLQDRSAGDVSEQREGGGELTSQR
jgi:hypothetical protein